MKSIYSRNHNYLLRRMPCQPVVDSTSSHFYNQLVHNIVHFNVRTFLLLLLLLWKGIHCFTYGLQVCSRKFKLNQFNPLIYSNCIFFCLVYGNFLTVANLTLSTWMATIYRHGKLSPNSRDDKMLPLHIYRCVFYTISFF